MNTETETSRFDYLEIDNDPPPAPLEPTPPPALDPAHTRRANLYSYLDRFPVRANGSALTPETPPSVLHSVLPRLQAAFAHLGNLINQNSTPARVDCIYDLARLIKAAIDWGTPAPVAPAPGVAPVDVRGNDRAAAANTASETIRASLAGSGPAPAPAPYVAPAPRLVNTVTNTDRAETMQVVLDAADATGAVVYWTAKQVQHADLLAAWLAAGLPADDLLDATSPEQALTRALDDLKSTGIIIDKKHPKGGAAIVARGVTPAKTLDFATAARVWVDKHGVLQYEREECDEATLAQLQDVLGGYFADHRARITGGDIGAWLVKEVYQLNATALRSSGGFYYVQNKSMPRLRTIQTALASVGTSVRALDVAKSSEVVAAVLDAIAIEAQDQLAKVREAMKDDHGKRWVAARFAELDVLWEKIQSYETEFGFNLQKAKANLRAVRGELDKYATRGSLLEVE